MTLIKSALDHFRVGLRLERERFVVSQMPVEDVEFVLCKQINNRLKKTVID